LTSGGTHVYKISKAQLPGNQAYYRMLLRQFTQLQVLLPGETNAPNTPSGKTGTPDPVSLGAGGLVTVTVNSVDSTFHIVNNNADIIALSSSTDPSALLPAPTQLANGSAQMLIQFDTTGSQTVTATDNTNTNIPPATSSAVTVGP
jgi:hypothetical protein